MAKKISLLLLILLLPLVLATCSTMIPQQNMLVQSSTTPSPIQKDKLVVLSLNLAHSRKDGVNQILLDKGSITNNLSDIADTLNRATPDIVALQEADGPSNWSGNFDHVGKLAQDSHYPTAARDGRGPRSHQTLQRVRAARAE